MPSPRSRDVGPVAFESASPSDPLDPAVDDGPSDFDMRNRFSATAVWQPEIARLTGAAGALVNSWQFSSRVIASDGFRFNATTGQDTNGDTVFNDRPAGQGYNSFELPPYVTLDLRLDRTLPIGGGRTVEFIAEGFNLTNRLNPTYVNRTWGPNATATAAFNTPTAAETARQFQLALRVSFLEESPCVDICLLCCCSPSRSCAFRRRTRRCWNGPA